MAGLVIREEIAHTRNVRQRPEQFLSSSRMPALAGRCRSTSPPHRLKPLARPCAFLLAARLGRAEVKTTRRLATRHGDGRRLGPRASISQAVRARRNASPLHVSLLGFAMASEASGDGVQNEPLAM